MDILLLSLLLVLLRLFLFFPLYIICICLIISWSHPFLCSQGIFGMSECTCLDQVELISIQPFDLCIYYISIHSCLPFHRILNSCEFYILLYLYLSIFTFFVHPKKIYSRVTYKGINRAFPFRGPLDYFLLNISNMSNPPPPGGPPAWTPSSPYSS